MAVIGGSCESFGMIGGKCENDCLALDDCMEDYDDTSEVRGLADVVPPVVGRNFVAATVIRGERSPRNDQTPVNVSILPADEDMSVELSTRLVWWVMTSLK